MPDGVNNITLVAPLLVKLIHHPNAWSAKHNAMRALYFPHDLINYYMLDVNAYLWQTNVFNARKTKACSCNYCDFGPCTASPLKELVREIKVIFSAAFANKEIHKTKYLFRSQQQRGGNNKGAFVAHLVIKICGHAADTTIRQHNHEMRASFEAHS